VKQRLWKTNLVPAQVCDGRSDRRIAYRDTDHESQCQAAVHYWLSELGRFAIFGIDMQWRRIVCQRTEPHVIGLCDRSPDRVPENLADRKFFEKVTGHRFHLALELQSARLVARQIMRTNDHNRRSGD
jgi:hypothetical protein